ncbi:MAG TPA: hypothetical protein VF765_30440 [Polyangiaceae bacterium]
MPRPAIVLAAPLVLAHLLLACSRERVSTPRPADAAGVVELSVRVPAALAVTRATDALSVAADPASFATTGLAARTGALIGVEADVLVFPVGQPRAVLQRHAVRSGADFGVASCTWNTARDGLPAPGTKYVVEMQLVVFETDAPLAPRWDPRAGHFDALWTRTLRQAEE